MSTRVNEGNGRNKIVLIIIAAALLVSALFFSYLATDKTHFQHAASEMESGSDVHYAIPGKHLPAQKWIASVIPAVIAVLLFRLRPKRLPAVPMAILRAFIPQRLKALFLMPIKLTSIYGSRLLCF